MSKQLKDFLTGLSNSAEVELAISHALQETGCKLFIDDGKENIYIPKKRLDSKIGELSVANDKIGELTTTITTLQGQIKGNEGAETTIAELQKSIKAYEDTVKDITIKNAVQSVAQEVKAKDSTGQDLIAFIDMSKVTIGADGTVTGIKEQVETLKTNKDYLFNIEPDTQILGLGGFLGTGSPGKPSNINTFGSKTTHEGDFGKMLANQNQSQSNENPIDSDYYFKK